MSKWHHKSQSANPKNQTRYQVAMNVLIRLKGGLPALLLIQLLVIGTESFAFTGPKTNHVRWNPTQCLLATEANNGDMPLSAAGTSRRCLLQGSVASVLLSVALEARAEDSPAPEGMVSAMTVAELLRVVPTFTLVDKKGAPFVVVGEDAKITGYFFTEFPEAQRILNSARKSADKALREGKKDPKQKEYMDGLTNPWKEARISTVSLDIAATLVTKSMYAPVKGGRNYFQVAPSEIDIANALSITGKEDLAEGKVPLFYYEDFTVETKGTKQSPLYFRKSELEKAYKKQNPGKSLPTGLVTELFAVVARMVEPGGSDEDLKTLVFVPPVESVQKAKECVRNNAGESPFLIGQRNLVL
jgi:hypothetical protein